MLYIIIGCLVGVALVPKLTDLYAKHVTKKTCDNLKSQIWTMEQNKNI